MRSKCHCDTEHAPGIHLDDDEGLGPDYLDTPLQQLELLMMKISQQDDMHSNRPNPRHFTPDFCSPVAKVTVPSGATTELTPCQYDEGSPVPLLPVQEYRCRYPGCSAPAFQTQYLLRFVPAALQLSLDLTHACADRILVHITMYTTEIGHTIARWRDVHEARAEKASNASPI